MKNPLLTRAGINRHIDRGFGQGKGGKYRPWLEIRHVPSRGKSTRILGWKTGRLHHLLSKLELQYFYLLEWADTVIDIREQYPLLPQRDTIGICANLRIKHPKEPKAETEMVMTTDFVIRTADGKEHPRSVKYSQDLENVRTAAKLEVERLYWKNKGYDWKLVTEKEIDEVVSKNIEWLHPKRDIKSLQPLSLVDVRKVQATIEDELLAGIKPLRAITQQCDDTLGYPKGSSLSVVRHLLANKVWHANMGERIEPMQPLKIQVGEYWQRTK